MTERRGAKRSEPVNGWNELLGPFYSASGVSDRLHLTEEELHQQVQQRKLLGLQTSEGAMVFPTFQFVQEGTEAPIVVQGLPEILEVFDYREPGTAWTLASWLKAGHLELGGKSVIDYLKETGDLEKPLAMSRSTASRWAH